MGLYDLLKPALFRVDPEKTHDWANRMLRLAAAVPGGPSAVRLIAGAAPRNLATEAFGLQFPNPLGLAAGFDKDARMLRVLPSMGFGFVEVGSITLRPQPGNPKPRLFRLPEHRAIINRMGFNSRGASAAARVLSKAPHSVPIGVNLGLNRDCPKDRAPEDYAETFSVLKPFGDYFVVNVSSPNTSGLRDLQEKRHLERILEAIQSRNEAKKPLLVKVAPDLTDAQLDDVLDAVTRLGNGVIATNTTIQRPGIPAEHYERQGGLSGEPLRELSLELIRKIRARTKLPIIGVGGIMSGADALDKILAGACLVQLYTAIIYRGPSAAPLVLRELGAALKARGFSSVAEAVGQERRQ